MIRPAVQKILYTLAFVFKSKDEEPFSNCHMSQTHASATALLVLDLLESIQLRKLMQDLTKKDEENIYAQNLSPSMMKTAKNALSNAFQGGLISHARFE